jgi:hypothetical protein
MKKNTSVKKVLLQHGPLGAVVTSLLLLANTASTSSGQVLPPDSHPYGLSYTTAKEGNVVANLFGVPCLPGDFTVYPAVSEGVFLMLAPLPPGKHVIQFVGLVSPVSSPFVESDLTYDITVKKDRDCDDC